MRSGFNIAAKMTAGLLLAGACLASVPAEAHVGVSDQDMKAYEGFVVQMRKPDGSNTCCDGKDAVFNVDEEIVTDPQTGEKRYFVYLTHDLDGIPLPEKRIRKEIPPQVVLTVEYALSVCAKIKRDNPGSHMAQTCEPPPTNLLWIGAVSENGVVHCYYPKPRGR